MLGQLLAGANRADACAILDHARLAMPFPASASKSAQNFFLNQLGLFKPPILEIPAKVTVVLTLEAI